MSVNILINAVELLHAFKKHRINMPSAYEQYYAIQVSKSKYVPGYYPPVFFFVFSHRPSEIDVDWDTPNSDEAAL